MLGGAAARGWDSAPAWGWCAGLRLGAALASAARIGAQEGVLLFSEKQILALRELA